MEAEETFRNFMDAWEMEDWPLMSSLLQLTASKFGYDAIKLRYTCGPFKILDYEIRNVEVISDTCVDIEATVSLAGHSIKKLVTARLVKERKPYKPSTWGTWGVNPVSVLKLE